MLALGARRLPGELEGRYRVFPDLGDTHDAIGDRDKAVTTWRLALELLDEIGHPEAQHVWAKLS